MPTPESPPTPGSTPESTSKSSLESKPGAPSGASPAARVTVTASAVVANPQGIHLRPATALARLCHESGCDVSLTYQGRVANVASVLELAMLAIGLGAELQLSVTGEEPTPTLEALVALVTSAPES